jgi:hypothetical protein
MTKSSIALFLQHEGNTLHVLLAKLKQLKIWNSWLNECLPEQVLLLEHCRIVGLDGASLIVIADNPHWVTRFRFFIPQLVVALRKYSDLKNIQSICCKVRPPLHFSSVKKPKRTRLIISENTAECLRETANKIQHEKLKNVLESIAKRAIPEEFDK